MFGKAFDDPKMSPIQILLGVISRIKGSDLVKQDSWLPMSEKRFLEQYFNFNRNYLFFGILFAINNKYFNRIRGRPSRDQKYFQY